MVDVVPSTVLFCAGELGAVDRVNFMLVYKQVGSNIVTILQCSDCDGRRRRARADSDRTDCKLVLIVWMQ